MPAKRSAKAAGTDHQWEAFLALSQLLDPGAADSSVYKRLANACRRLTHLSCVTRDALILEAGLSFFDDCAAPDLALMSLVRSGILRPILAQPFCFDIARPSNAPTALDSDQQSTRGDFHACEWSN